MRASLASGLADLHRPLNWGLGHVKDPALKAKYQQAVDFLTDLIRFTHTIGADRSSKLETIDLFTSHEEPKEDEALIIRSVYLLWKRRRRARHSQQSLWQGS